MSGLKVSFTGVSCAVLSSMALTLGLLGNLLVVDNAGAKNPLNSGIGQRFDDPHGFVDNGRVYLFASHDFSPKNRKFVLKDWWVWSSPDLVSWRLESVIKPEETFIGKPFDDCWATYGVCRNGRWYMYFSAGVREIGVVTANSPSGPWWDPLGKPLIPDKMVATSARDPGILLDGDGAAYMVFGAFNYYLVRLGDDMVSLAEPPRPIVVKNAEGVFGKGKTDDKPNLHKHNGIYYLSWGCFYATADQVYGPYTFRGSVISPDRIAPEFRTKRTYGDRHGNFFEFNNQWYFACNDMSQPGDTPVYRQSIMGYVHYRDNGGIAPVRIDRIGVGEYDAAQPRIEAEDFFKAVKAVKRETPDGGFEMRELANGSELEYPNIHNLPLHARLRFRVASAHPKGGEIEVREGNPCGRIMGSCRISGTGGWSAYGTVDCQLDNGAGTAGLCFLFKGDEAEFCRLDSFAFGSKIK